MSCLRWHFQLWIRADALDKLRMRYRKLMQSSCGLRQRRALTLLLLLLPYPTLPYVSGPGAVPGQPQRVEPQPAGADPAQQQEGARPGRKLGGGGWAMDMQGPLRPPQVYLLALH